MAESTARDHAQIPSTRRRWLLVGASLDRIGRWIFYGVILAATPIAVSIAFLPKTTSVTSLLSHGDFAILATALGGASIGELLAPDEPPKWLRNILISSCILLIIASTVLLGVIAGYTDKFTESQKADYSWILFIIGVVAGIASIGSTVHRPPRTRHTSSPSSPKPGPQGDGEST